MFNLNQNKKYIILYVLLVAFFSVSFLNYENYLHPAFEAIVFVLIIILGLVSIVYYSNNTKNLHKVAFLIIILFGITCVFLTPIDDVSDELEHFTRSEIISTGQISTSYVPIPNLNESGYETIKSVDILSQNAGSTVFDTDADDEKIDYTPAYLNSAFSQNPFYAYLAQGLGILLAKLLDLNSIWMLWLGRLFNLILYATIISLAIRKTPILKFPMLIVSILPLAIYQAASLSTDGLFSALALLAIGYFLHFYKNKVSWKDMSIFYMAIILSGLLKAPFLALSLLVFLVPKENFENRTQNIISKVAILAALAIGLAWSSYATGVLVNSWRADHFLANNVSASGQISYLFSNPLFAIDRFFDIFTQFPIIIERFFYFSNDVRDYSSSMMAILYFIYMILFSVFYPLEEKFSVKTRVRSFLIAALIYISVIIVQYLTWASVAAESVMNGVFSRYFMPLLIFIPMLLGGYYKEGDENKLALTALTVALGFISGMIMLTVSVKY